MLTIINHGEIYMEIFLPSAQAHLISIGSEARIKLDILDVAIPAKVSFVSPRAQFTPNRNGQPSCRTFLPVSLKQQARNKGETIWSIRSR